jgi:hypothetical protein
MESICRFISRIKSYFFFISSSLFLISFCNALNDELGDMMTPPSRNVMKSLY